MNKDICTKINLLWPHTAAQALLPEYIREVLGVSNLEHIDIIESECIKNWLRGRSYQKPSTFFRKFIVDLNERLKDDPMGTIEKINRVYGAHLKPPKDTDVKIASEQPHI